MASPGMPTYKLVMVGDAGVGKSQIVHRAMNIRVRYHWNGQNVVAIPVDPFHECITLGVEVHPLCITMPSGNVKFNVWDLAAAHKGSGSDDFYKKADCAIVVVDAQMPNLVRANEHANKIRALCGNIPILLVANKADEVCASFPPNRTFVGLVNVSAKKGRNIYAPFKRMAMVMGH
jgi:GTPase SAR1 family protein